MYGQIETESTDSKGSSPEAHDRACHAMYLLSMCAMDTHDRVDCDSPALDVTAALGVSHAVRPMSDCSDQGSDDSALAAIEEDSFVI